MALLAVIAVIVLGVVLLTREHQFSRERATTGTSVQEVRAALDACRMQLRRTAEDLYVIQTVLSERNLLDDNELARARLRLIEAPRRMAEERAAMARHLKVSPTQLMLDSAEPKIH